MGGYINPSGDLWVLHRLGFEDGVVGIWLAFLWLNLWSGLGTVEAIETATVAGIVARHLQLSRLSHHSHFVLDCEKFGSRGWVGCIEI